MKPVRLPALCITIMLAVGACATQGSGPDTDSETHWLGSCQSGTDCATGEVCACGLCTSECDELSACDGDAPAACAPRLSIPTCGLPGPALCVATCEDVACPVGTLCRDGTCLPEPPARAFDVQNPTGSCEPLTDGARPGYHSPDPGDVYVPDCSLEIPREYIRVFATDPDTAYLIPRPPADGMLDRACRVPSDPAAALAQKYGLCDPVQTSEAVDRVNSMSLADALELAHILNAGLLFRAVDVGIFPAPFPDDVLFACALHPETRSDALVRVCGEYQTQVDTGAEVGVDFGGIGVELALLLNEVYGIPADRAAVFDPSLCSAPEQTGLCATARVASFRYDPATAACVPYDFGGCGEDYNHFETQGECQQLCGGRASACDPSDDCSSCPLTLDSSGESCDVTGLSCTWGGCGGGICTCSQDSSGGLAWQCLVNAC